MVKGERIRQARELKGLTQAELADRLQMNQSAVAHLESGRYEPTDEVIRTIAFATGFPPAFFNQGPTPDFSLGSLAFRVRAAMTAREKLQAYRYAQITFELSEFFGKRVDQIAVRLPQIQEEPKKAAQSIRAALGLSPDQPISNLTNALERNGVLILALPIDLATQDAFSLWAGEGQSRPVVAISIGKPGDRCRFSLAHELRHLSRINNGTLSEVEEDADRFASEFLLPEKTIRQELRPPLTLTTIAPLKPRWGVSMQALIRRAFDLGIIMERQYKYLMQQMSIYGWRVQEPPNLAVPTEKPRALRRMAELLYGIPIDYRKLATDVGFPLALVREILEAHATKPGDPAGRRGEAPEEAAPFSTSKLAAKVVPFKRTRN
jgi:Zn-dependent peptidase ImmA (M78 family)/DNA-binding XRE family transcriptional regulator